MKKKYEKPEIISEKMEMNLLHTVCTPGNNLQKNYYKTGLPPQFIPICDPPACDVLGAPVTIT
jgi:hypothetical protein